MLWRSTNMFPKYSIFLCFLWKYNIFTFLKGLGNEINIYLEVFNIKWVLSVYSLMVFKNLSCLIVEQIKISFACFYAISLQSVRGRSLGPILEKMKKILSRVQVSISKITKSIHRSKWKVYICITLQKLDKDFGNHQRRPAYKVLI